MKDLKPHYLIKSLMKWYLLLTATFKGYSKIASKASKELILNLYQFTSTV